MYRVAQVAIPLALNREFDYSFAPQKTNLKIGMRVFVDFNGKKMVGLVVGLNKNSKLKYLKPIITVLDKEPVLSQEHIDFADRLSSIYPYARGEFLFMMIPSRLKKTTKTPFSLEGGLLESRGVKEKKAGKITFVKADTFLERYAHWRDLVKAKLQEGSVFICFPQLSYLETAEKIIRKDFPLKIKVIHSQVSEKELFAGWRESRRNVLILGTRLAAFYYPLDLELMIVEQDNSRHYFQEEKPFYHLRDIAFLLADIKKADLIFSGDFPSLTTYKFIEDKNIVLRDYGKTVDPKIKIVNLSEFTKSKVLSPVLIELIRKGLKNQKRMIIFWNKKGFGRAMICSNCRQVLKCKRCSANLQITFGGKEGICPHCQQREDVPKICNFCKNGYFKNIGYGIERLEVNLKKIFPEARIDSWSNYSHDSQIVLTTSQVISHMEQLKNFDWGFCLDVDSSLSRIDYNAAFDTFIYLKRLSLFLKDSLHIFTSNPNYYMFEYLEKHWHEFYLSELKLRRDLDLPPFGLILKVTLRAKNKNTLLKRSEYIYNKLKAKFSEVYGPSAEQPFKLRDNFRYSVIAKTKRDWDSRKIIQEEISRIRTSAVKMAISLH